MLPTTAHTDTDFFGRPPAEFIPPVQEPYQYIIFRASEVKDLAVDEPEPRRSVHDDPAVLGVSILSPFIPEHIRVSGSVTKMMKSFRM